MNHRAAKSIVRNIQPMSHEEKQEVRNNFNFAEGYFGKELDHEAPIIVCDCISFIRNRGFYETGVFRIPGNLDVVSLLKQKYNDRFKNKELKEGNGYSVLNKHRPAPSVNDVASLLKLYFTELPEPLVPRYITDAMLEIASLNLDGKDECLYLGKLVKRIPSPNRECLGLLISFLRELCAFRKFNHMTADNLATCFVLSVFGRGNTSKQIILVTTGTKIIKQLIAGEIKIFMPSVRNVKNNTRYKDEIKGERKPKPESKVTDVPVQNLYSKPKPPQSKPPPKVPARSPKSNLNKYQGIGQAVHVQQRSGRAIPDLPSRPPNETQGLPPRGRDRPLPKPNTQHQPGYSSPSSEKNRFGNRKDGYGNNAGNLFGGFDIEV